MDPRTSQAEIDRLIKRSEVFAWIWLMGIGSVLCITSALQAAKLMKAEGTYDGKRIIKPVLLGVAGLLTAVAGVLIIIIFGKARN